MALMSAYVSIRQHMSAHISISASAYVSVRQHVVLWERMLCFRLVCACMCVRVCVRGGQHTSAYVSIRQHTSAYVSIRQHTGGARTRLGV
jgi:hypothetical protein